MPISLTDQEKANISSAYHNRIVRKTYNNESGNWDYHDDEGGVHKVYGASNTMGAKKTNQTAKALGIQD
jgi:hypothetical protein